MNRRKQITNRKLTAEQKYYIMQKTVGVLVLVLGTMLGLWAKEAAALFISPLMGLVLIFSNDKVLMIGEVYWEENPLKNAEKVPKNTQKPMEKNSDMCYNRRRNYVER